MASTFKTFGTDDQTVTTTNLHEVIPITGTIVSGTYSDNNIKNYVHSMFQSIYDYPYLSSSANHIVDITLGYSADSPYAKPSQLQNTKKINIYNQFAKVLVQPDTTGSIQEFDQDGNISGGGEKMKECVFFSFSRLLVKDEIKKGSFRFSIQAGSDPLVEYYDAGAQTDYKVNSPAGEYGLVYTNSAGTGDAVGHVYYQAGIFALSGSQTADGSIFAEEIPDAMNMLRSVWSNLQFNNTTELNSSIYFCRAGSNEFNYSSNSTYLSGSQIVMKNSRTDTPASYITSIGLYSSDNVLLATAKISEPLKKDPTNELTLRVRLDY